MKEKKPPLGAIPEKIMKGQRVKELSSAINRYIQGGYFYKDDANLVEKWCEELIRRLKKFK